MTKYNNRRVKFDGYSFDSVAEWNRYMELKLLVAAGSITRLEVHPRFKLMVNGQLVCVYVGDFRYYDYDGGRTVVEDVKSEITRKLPVYRLKKKLMAAIHGIEIVEVIA